MPSRGLHALSLATTFPDWSATVMSKRIRVGRQPVADPPGVVDEAGVRQEVEPSLSSMIGFHWMVVVPSPRKIGKMSFSPAPVPVRIAPALRMR